MTAVADERHAPLPAPDRALLIRLLRENTRLLSALVADHEVGRLEAVGNARVVRGPEDVADYLGPEMADLAQEQLRAVSLDVRNRILGIHLVAQGGLNTAVIRPADCFREAIRANAASIVLLHNHPSRDPAPSPDDVRLTTLLGRIGADLGIDLLDHLIIGGARHVSLRRLGLYTPLRAAVGADSAPGALER